MDEQKKVFGQLNKVFAAQGLFLSQIGRDIDTPAIDKKTGTWTEKGLFAKSPRFIIQLRLDAQGNLEAGQFVTNATAGKLGYINTAKNQIGGVLIRVLPVMTHPNFEFEAIADWEWLLVLAFSEPITGGGSSDSLDNFFPPLNTINWKYRANVKSVEIKGASLFSIAPLTPAYNYTPTGLPAKAITYNEATQAVGSYLSFDF